MTEVPRLLGLYDDEYDGDGTPVGWRVEGWALELPEGRGAVTVPAQGPVNATLWHSLDAAVEALDLHVDEIQPRRPKRRVLGDKESAQ